MRNYRYTVPAFNRKQWPSGAQRREEVRLPQHDLARHDHKNSSSVPSSDHSELDHAGSFTRSLGQFQARHMHKIPWFGRWTLGSKAKEMEISIKKRRNRGKDGPWIKETTELIPKDQLKYIYALKNCSLFWFGLGSRNMMNHKLIQHLENQGLCAEEGRGLGKKER